MKYDDSPLDYLSGYPVANLLSVNVRIDTD